MPILTRAGQLTETGMFIGYSIKNGQVYELVMLPDSLWAKLSPNSQTCAPRLQVSTTHIEGLKNTKILADALSTFGMYADGMSSVSKQTFFVPSLYEVARVFGCTPLEKTYPVFGFSMPSPKCCIPSLEVTHGNYRVANVLLATSTFQLKQDNGHLWSEYLTVFGLKKIVTHDYYFYSTVVLFGESKVNLD